MQEDQVINGIHLSSDEKNYVYETNEKVLNSLEHFKDMKLGFMTHFGLFSQLGIVESWGLSDEVQEDRWSQDGIEIKDFKKQYRALNCSFNPICLDTDKIVEFIKSCGFKYFIIPTKHHDGFCLWDTKFTDYKIKSKDCPFKRDVYNEFRKSCYEKNISIGAYFSKADWNNNDYWEHSKLDDITSRHPTYDRIKNKTKWSNFVKFTHNQISEITSNDYPVDILWLDAGWVRKGRNQDIDIDKIASIGRYSNDSMLIVDRACGGINENYITPEQVVFSEYKDVPWESCISLGPGFAYDYNDKYKNEYELGHIFIEVISKGGNLVLNVALEPNGNLPSRASMILSRFSKWYTKYDNIIYGCRSIHPHYCGNIGYIVNKEKKYMLIKNDIDSVIESHIYINSQIKVSKLLLILDEEHNLEYTYIGKRLKITMPKQIVGHIADICYVINYIEEL